MKIKHTQNGGIAEVSEELGTRLVNDGTGQWSALDEDEKPKRTRRTKAQIAADEAAAQTEE